MHYEYKYTEVSNEVWVEDGLAISIWRYRIPSDRADRVTRFVSQFAKAKLQWALSYWPNETTMVEIYTADPKFAAPLYRSLK